MDHLVQMAWDQEENGKQARASVGMPRGKLGIISNLQNEPQWVQ
jgi:hypothetical protein